MIKKQINQNDRLKLELLNSIEFNYVFANKPINRLKNITKKPEGKNENKSQQLDSLKKKINSIEDCKLKKNSHQLVFGDGNIDSPLMIIGGAPGEKEDISGTTYSGDDGSLLEKMLIAINIKKKNIYTT